MLNVLHNRRTHARAGDPVQTLVDISAAAVEPVPQQVYTGSPVTPVPVITYEGEALVEGEDFSLSWSNNTAVGTGLIAVVGLGRFTGSRTVTFRLGSSWDFVLRAAKLQSWTALRDPSQAFVKGSVLAHPVVHVHGGHTYLFGLRRTDVSNEARYCTLCRVDITDIDWDAVSLDGLPTQEVNLGINGLKMSVVFNSSGTEVATAEFVYYDFYDGGEKLVLICGRHPWKRNASSYNPGPSVWEVQLSAPYDLSVLEEAEEIDETWRLKDDTLGEQYGAWGFSYTRLRFGDNMWNPSGSEIYAVYSGDVNVVQLRKFLPGGDPFCVYDRSRTATATMNGYGGSYTYPTFGSHILGNSASKSVDFYKLLESRDDSPWAGDGKFTAPEDLVLAEDGSAMIAAQVKSAGPSNTAATSLFRVNYSEMWDFCDKDAVESVEKFTLPLVPDTTTHGGYLRNAYSGSANAIVKVGGDKLLVFTGSEFYAHQCTYLCAYHLPSPDLSVSAEVGDIPVQFYTGSAVTPEPTVVVGSLTLVKDTDYTVEYEDNVGSADVPQSTARILIHGIGDFRGTKVVEFLIGHFQDFVTVDDIEDQAYAGLVPVCPSVTAYDHEGNELVPGPAGDYTISYEDNTHPGTARAVLHGVYQGEPWTVEKEFTITCDLSTYGLFQIIPDQEYSGHAVTPTPGMVLADGFVLVAGQDFEVTGYSNNTSTGTASVTVAGLGLYSGSKTATFLIRYSAASYMAVAPLDAQLYQLDQPLPEPAVSVTGVGGAALTLNSDYIVAYTYVPPGTNVVGSVTAVVTGIGAYMGSVSTNAAPLYRSLADAYVDPPIPDQMYSGFDVQPEFTLKIEVPTAFNDDGTIKTTTVRTLVANTDYVISAWQNNRAGGTAKAIVKGITTNGFAGTLEVPFVISYAAPGTYFSVAAVSQQSMTGPAPVTPTLNVTCSNGLTLVLGTDYVVEYSDNTGPGTATAVVRGIGAYVKLDPVTVQFIITSSFAIAAISDQSYTGGTPVCPEPVVTGWDGTTLAKSTDYVVSYEDNLTVGTATLTVSGVRGGVAWSAQKTFRIVAALTSQYVKVDSIPDQLAENADSVLTPEFAVKLDNGVQLVEGEDFELEWDDNVGPGEATVTLTGKGLYSGTKTIGFTIRSSLPVHAVATQLADLKIGWGRFGESGSGWVMAVGNGNITVDGVSKTARYFTANAAVLAPSVTFTSEGETLYEGSDYFKRYIRTAPRFYVASSVANKAVPEAERVLEVALGSLQAEAEGAGIYIGSAFTNVANVRADIACAFVRLGKYSVYAGLPVRPSVEVYAFLADANDTSRNFTAPPAVAELDEGHYLAVVSNALKEYDAAGRPVGDYTPPEGATWIWDFNAVALYYKQANSSNWAKYASPVYQYPLKPADYSVSFADNDAVGTATVTVHGVNGFAGTVSREFEIFHPFAVTIASQEATGSALTPAVVVKNRVTGATLVEGTDYDVDDGGQDFTDAGDYDITVEPKGSYAYAPGVTAVFTITEQEGT